MSKNDLIAPHARLAWLEKWMATHGPVDILNAEFVDEYAEATGANVVHMNMGANRCPMLAQDLRSLWELDRASRGRVALGLNWQPGFPRWVWSYELSHRAGNSPAYV